MASNRVFSNEIQQLAEGCEGSGAKASGAHGHPLAGGMFHGYTRPFIGIFDVCLPAKVGLCKVLSTIPRHPNTYEEGTLASKATPLPDVHR